jgi:hypothetical protein
LRLAQSPEITGLRDNSNSGMQLFQSLIDNDAGLQINASVWIMIKKYHESKLGVLVCNPCMLSNSISVGDLENSHHIQAIINACSKILKTNCTRTMKEEAALTLITLIPYNEDNMNAELFKNIFEDISPWKSSIVLVFSKLRENACWSRFLIDIGARSPQLLIPHFANYFSDITLSRDVELIDICLKIIDSIGGNTKESVETYSKIYSEFQHVTVLLEEFWINELGKIATQYHHLIAECDNIQDVQSKPTKFKALITPIVSQINLLLTSTVYSSNLVSPYQIAFKKKYEVPLVRALESLTTLNSPLKECWSGFRLVSYYYL